MMGIRHVVLAINKMDLLGFEPTVFERIVADYRAFAAKLGFETIHAIALSALEGDNVCVQRQYALLQRSNIDDASEPDRGRHQG